MAIMELRILALDVTSLLDPEGVTIFGQTFEMFLYDAYRHVYCCEATPSFELQHYDTWCMNELNETEQEMFADMISNTEPVSYVHAWRIVKTKTQPFKTIEYDSDEDYKEKFQENLEWLRANPIQFGPER